MEDNKQIMNFEQSVVPFQKMMENKFPLTKINYQEFFKYFVGWVCDGGADANEAYALLKWFKKGIEEALELPQFEKAANKVISKYPDQHGFVRGCEFRLKDSGIKCAYTKHPLVAEITEVVKQATKNKLKGIFTETQWTIVNKKTGEVIGVLPIEALDDEHITPDHEIMEHKFK